METTDHTSKRTLPFIWQTIRHSRLLKIFAVISVVISVMVYKIDPNHSLGLSIEVGLITLFMGILLTYKSERRIIRNEYARKDRQEHIAWEHRFFARANRDGWEFSLPKTAGRKALEEKILMEITV